MNLILALFGWSKHIHDGTTVWVHITGVVVYNEGPQSDIPNIPNRRFRVRRIRNDLSNNKKE